MAREMKSERDPMLRGRRRGSTDKGSRKEEEKAAYINRGKCHLLFSFLPAHQSVSLWFASYRHIFSAIFKRKVA